ncbi:insulinase family protein [Streptomyces sp. NBC_00820]|uniref:M16 family metallopeptidase n=1 Tax=Streptomyces sp. NBC_00820 TaxID=2975842 RepID=UPI002ED34359|nr:insulinase family protein [Streptomyces sp. NBC_00820]
MEKYRLTGGATLLGRAEDHWRTTSLCLAVDFGSRHDPPGGGGTAHLMEHLLMSAPTAGGCSLVEYVQRLGGSANATTGLDRMLFQVRVLNRDAPEVAALLARSVLRPVLTEEALESERKVVLQELAAAAADPSDVVQDAFLGRIFAGHPLGRPVGGTRDELLGADVKTVLDTHRERFLRRPMTLAAVGGTPHAELRAALADSPLGEPAADPPWPGEGAGAPEPLASDLAVCWPDDDFCWLAVGGRAPAVHDERRHVYTVLADLLGANPASLLYRRLRGEEGLAYMFFAWARAYRDTGAWRVMVGTEAANGPAVLALVRRLLTDLAEHGPDPDDLAVARRQAVAALLMDTEDPVAYAQRIAMDGAASAAEPDGADSAAALEAVTGDDIRDAAARLCEELTAVVRPDGEAA